METVILKFSCHIVKLFYDKLGLIQNIYESDFESLNVWHITFNFFGIAIKLKISHLHSFLLSP